MVNNIIRFPKTRKRRKNINDVLVDRLTDTHNHVDLGLVPFTCPECDSKSEFNFSGVIFKHLTFYCATCGHGYKVTNPMFSEHQLMTKFK
jgi:hypothetical protein